MKALSIMEVIFIIAITIFVWDFFRRITRENELGSLIFKMSKNFRSEIGLIFSLLILIMGIASQINYRPSPLVQENPYRLLLSFIAPFCMILNLLLSMYTAKEIRENGITSPKGEFILWDDVLEYEWTEQGQLKIWIKSECFFSGKNSSVKWSVKEEEREKVDRIVQTKLRESKVTRDRH